MRGWAWPPRWPRLVAILGLASGLIGSVAHAVEIELADVAADRVERQRAYARGATPLPGTPDLAKLDDRLSALGLAKGNPIFIRIFKETSELELWMQREADKRFVLLATYPICHWTGTIGPKIKEGDRQSPEGFYTVRWQQTRLVGRWRNAFNLGFPNHFDQLNGRTGSHILVHGGCSSVGCYAMTEQVQDEIFGLASAAIAKGHGRFHVHVFPFRMTDENLERYRNHTWIDFWRDLKAGYDSFERTRLPPRVAICERRYQVADGAPEDGGNPVALNLLRPSMTSVSGIDGYQPPRCEMEGDRARTARFTPTASERDEPTPQAPNPVTTQPAPQRPPALPKRPKVRQVQADVDDEAEVRPARKQSPARASAAARQPRAKAGEEAEAALGRSPSPGAPRIMSVGN